MANSHLATYLNDHLSGATAALELLEHLKSWYAGTDIENVAATLYADIAEDRQVLETLMERLGISKSVPRRVAAWLAEKAANLKLKLDDPSAKGLRLLESAEALSLGIEGKRLLWVSLESAVEAEPALRGLDFPQLQERAVEQRVLVEKIRLGAARTVINGP